MNDEYVVFARKYRPQNFSQIYCQDVIVRTLKNSLQRKRIAQAYLFCGQRGTGKTTLARVFAKALNCTSLSEELEPCNRCSSCLEISQGISLDVIEIDGASNRGIDDIRKITETIGYSASSGGYKIYIIDEVHMLTKEAFNALLKTLEEPPAKSKFFFATTEVQKIPATILSRCQRFQLNSITQEMIVAKLKTIAQDMQFEVEDQALYRIAAASEGALRDAESMFDQITSFIDNAITVSEVEYILGLPSYEWFFGLDRAMQEQNIAEAFYLVQKITQQGKSLETFLEGLLEHIQHLLHIHLIGINSYKSHLPYGTSETYAVQASYYTKEQCEYLLEYLVEGLHRLKTTPLKGVALESILIHVIKSKYRISIDLLTKKLAELQSQIHVTHAPNSTEKVEQPLPPAATPPPPVEPVKEIETKLAPVPPTPQPVVAAPKITVQTQAKYDTIMQFAAIELEGSLKREFKALHPQQ